MDSDTVSRFEKFLEYGPLGLAGLMLVLVILALLSGKLTAERAGILKLFMFIGAFCFVAALGAEFILNDSEHEMQIVVAPNDLGTEQRFPPPIIRVNGVPVNREQPVLVNSRTTVLVDVTDALGVFRQVEQRAAVTEAALEEVDTLATQLSKNIEAFSAGAARVPPTELQKLKELESNITSTIEMAR